MENMGATKIQKKNNEVTKKNILYLWAQMRSLFNLWINKCAFYCSKKKITLYSVAVNKIIYY